MTLPLSSPEMWDWKLKKAWLFNVFLQWTGRERDRNRPSDEIIWASNTGYFYVSVITVTCQACQPCGQLFSHADNSPRMLTDYFHSSSSGCVRNVLGCPLWMISWKTKKAHRRINQLKPENSGKWKVTSTTHLRTLVLRKIKNNLWTTFFSSH